MRRLLSILATLTFALGLLLAGGAAKPTPTPATITIAASSQVTFGGTISFDTTLPNLKLSLHPEISVACSQGSSLVYLSAGAPDTLFTLGSFGSVWYTTGGPASCVADLFYYVWQGQTETGRVDLADMTFIAS